MTFQFRHVCGDPAGEHGFAKDVLYWVKGTAEMCKKGNKFGFQESSDASWLPEIRVPCSSLLVQFQKNPS